MTTSERLQAAIETRTAEIVSHLPADRIAATIALVKAIDANPEPTFPAPSANPFTGIPIPALGASRALHLLLTAPSHGTSSALVPDTWAATFLDQCRQLSEAELTLAHLETGFMRWTAATETTLDVRIARRSSPARWREREDAAWWADHQRRLPTATATDRVAHLAMLVDLPSHTGIDGVDLDLARTVIAQLMTDMASETTPQILAEHLAKQLDAPTPDITAVLQALTLTPENAEWHAAVPGIADPPLIALGDGQSIISRRGIRTDPFRFLTRELRRRAPDVYHTAAVTREAVFRNDLFALFAHRRFVTSRGRIELRHEKGTIRTDIDAAVFDRKTGTLALFELKSHEPYARSTAELERTQGNVRAAGRQIAGILDWINRHGANEILNRMDRRTAKGFRVHKVQPFVLGRHLLDGGEGAPLDPRAAWATWPTILRLLDGRGIETLGTNPITSLAALLTRSEPLISPQSITAATPVDLGAVTLRVHPPR